MLGLREKFLKASSTETLISCEATMRSGLLLKITIRMTLFQMNAAWRRQYLGRIYTTMSGERQPTIRSQVRESILLLGAWRHASGR